MVLPLLLGVGALGAFVGSQIDDAVEMPAINPRANSVNDSPSFFTIALYGGTAIALVYGARKAGLLRL